MALTKKQTKEDNSQTNTPIVGERKIDTHKIILRPLITEKGNDMAQDNKYLFEVARKTTKSEIKKAIESEFKVNVLSVRVISMKGKSVRYGRTSGKQKDWKKAIIKIKKGQKIEIYQGI